MESKERPLIPGLKEWDPRDGERLADKLRQQMATAYEAEAERKIAEIDGGGGRKIEFGVGTTIDQAFEMLQEHENKGEPVYGYFNGIKLSSSGITLDRAYLAVTGLSKAEFDIEAEKEGVRRSK
jgi:hypothetical protein